MTTMLKTYRVYVITENGLSAVIVNAWNRADAILKAREENPDYKPTGKVEELGGSSNG